LSECDFENRLSGYVKQTYLKVMHVLPKEPSLHPYLLDMQTHVCVCVPPPSHESATCAQSRRYSVCPSVFPCRTVVPTYCLACDLRELSHSWAMPPWGVSPNPRKKASFFSMSARKHNCSHYMDIYNSYFFSDVCPVQPSGKAALDMCPSGYCSPGDSLLQLWVLFDFYLIL